jgi:molybdopterin synthase catalytic subunit
MTVVIAEVSAEALDLSAHESAVADPRAGAVVTFQGVVRDHDQGRGVTLLEYEGHPSAAALLREVAAEIAAVKSRLPIWKRQVFGDGTEEWVNCP